jgi:hypothetical protein
MGIEYELAEAEAYSAGLVDPEPDPDDQDSNPFGEEFDTPPANASGSKSTGKRRITFDRWGRYNNLPPVPGYEDVRGWTRVSTLKETLEDQYRLEAWKRRQVVLGLKRNPGLLQSFTRQLDPRSKFGKDKLNRIADQAMDLAGSAEGADAGTARHEIIEAMYDPTNTLDRDLLEPEELEWLQGFELIIEAKKIRFIPAYAERPVVIPSIGCAGTLDTILWHEDRMKIGDLKTQRWKPGLFDRIGLSVQLGCYANAAYMLDFDTWSWQNMPQVDRTEGVIIWAPAEKPGVCKPLGVDLEFGWEAALASRQAREWRNRKGIIYDL